MSITPNSIVTPQAPFSRTAVVTAAETNFNAPVNTVTLLDRAANVNGVRISRLYAIARAAIATANNIQVYAYDGTTKTLIESALMPTQAPGASVANAKTDFGYSDDSPMFLNPGVGLEVALGLAVANGVTVRCEGGQF